MRTLQWRTAHVGYLLLGALACSNTRAAKSFILSDAAVGQTDDASAGPEVGAKDDIARTGNDVALADAQAGREVGDDVGRTSEVGRTADTGQPDVTAETSRADGTGRPTERGPADAQAPADAVVAVGTPGQACAAEPLRSTGQIHYVCDCQSGADSKCVAGNDNNAGTSPSAPLRTFSKAADTFSKMKAGDTVALCRGGRWSGPGGGFANPTCSKDNTCDLRDYVPPWADGSESLPSLWIDGGSNGATLITFTHPSAHYEGYRVLNLDLHGTSADTAIFFYNETTNVDLCNLSMDGFNESVNMSGGDKPDFGTPAYIVLRGSRITNNTNIGYIAVCDYCSVEDSYFDNDGVRDATTHSVYFASQAWTVNGQVVVHTSMGMRMSRNEIHHSTQPCKGAPMVVHGRHQDVVIENNLIDAVSATDGCWGPGVGCGGYEYGCWYRNTIIRGNTFKNLGNSMTDNSNCVGCSIENNLFIVNRSGNAISLGGDMPRPAGDASYTKWDGSPDDPTTDAVVRNNTIYFTDAASSGVGIAVFSGTGHVIENNAIYFATAQAGSSDTICLRLPSNPASVVAQVDDNVCKIPSNGHWASYPPDYGTSLSAWQSATGFDKHSKQTDPLFVNAPADFTPSATSPLVGGADPGNSPADDLTGKARDSQPDIGAFER